MVTKVKEDRMTTTSELKPVLKRLRLGYMLNTLPERLAWPGGTSWTMPPFYRYCWLTR